MRRHLLGIAVLAHLVAVTLPSAGVRNRVSTWYGDVLGAKQGWSMFAGVSDRNGAVTIEVFQRGKWTRVFQEGSSEWTWNRRRFTYYRWRELFSVLERKKLRGDTLERFGGWVATAVLEDYPEACRVRVRVLMANTLRPSELSSGQVREYRAERRRTEQVTGACP